jgi:hypothetical protein
VRYSPALRAVMVRSFMFALGTSAMWAVLPLVARVGFRLDATGYGIVVAFFGVGAAVCGAGLSILRRALSTNAIAMTGGFAFAAANATIGWAHNVYFLWAASFIAGAAWVRARALAMYLLVLQGGLAIGSVGWGYIASLAGVRTALDLSGLFLFLSQGAAMRFSLESAEHFDPNPWVPLLPQLNNNVPLEQGPVLVSIEYRIDPARAADFERAMYALEPIRRRDGAVMWGLFGDTVDPGRFVETFMVETWAEHMRQHYRLTVSDSETERYVRSFHVGAEPPVVSHLIAPMRM